MDNDQKMARAPTAVADVGADKEQTFDFYVVGIGASAGGLEALEAFFNNIKPDSGMAFIVVQHLSPDFKSLMDELLSRYTDVDIHRVENGMVIEPNAIYLIPPKKDMIMSGRQLLLRDKDPSEGLNLPIDTFFRSLAQEAGSHAVSIILSGTGSDGSRGIRAIHEAGGLVLVQDEATAKFDGMPRAAVNTGVVDLVLPPSEMAEVLLNHVQHPNAALGKEAPAIPVTEDGMQTIFKILRQEYGIDFSHYKPSTVMRRIERRLQLVQASDLDDYVARLRSDRVEVNALYKDLLIGVTKFFRDQEAFAILENEILPEIIDKVPPNDEIRIWVAGCATGEEAYSIAILLHEQLTAKNRPINVKIFATDVHKASLDFASAGRYSEESLSEVTPKRLQRYFHRKDSGYQVTPDLRQMVVFACHNVIKDAPFTKLDLISCRNLLIYLEPPAQKKVISLFHFGLKTGSVLFLGPSEMPGELSDEFEFLNKHWKIFRKRREGPLPPDVRLPLAPGYNELRPGGSTVPPPSPKTLDTHLIRAYDLLLDSYVPPSILINDKRQLLHTFTGAGKYLAIRDGRSSSDVLDLLDKDLRLCVVGALQRAAKERKAAVYSGVPMGEGKEEQQLKVTVRPIINRDVGVTHFLIVFEELEKPAVPADLATPIDLAAVSRERMQALDEELRYTKESLQATIEELETSNEELQATNEELVAANEELQSTNEELHSVNEELYTVNAEHQRKIAELTQLTNDMDNLLRGTEIGTIFLDEDLRIRKFTPQITKAFQILPQDTGRRIDTFSHSIDYPNLQEDVSRVLKEDARIEKEVRDRQGNWYLLRILPYRSNVRVEGVVMTLVDITNLKQVQQKLQLMSKVFADGADPIVIENLHGRIIDLNKEAERVYGWSREELLGQATAMLVPPEQHQRMIELRQRCLQADHVRNIESVRQDKTGRRHPVLLTLSLLTDEQGMPIAIASIAKDISRQKNAEHKAVEAAQRRDHFLAMLSHELRNPLGAVINATRVLDHSELTSDMRDQSVRVIQRQSRQMARLLDDLLDVSRFTQGKIELRRQICDLTKLVPEAVQTVQPLLEARQHQIDIRIDEEPLWVEGDPARLLQIQENLLTNAVKYTPPEGKIDVHVLREGEEAVLRIRDNGIGIASELLGSIFDLFVQHDTSLDRSGSGMGVGLTLVRLLAQMHGGNVTAHSDGPDNGSEFTVRLPLTKKRPRQRAGETPTPQRKKHLKILIIEDNADSRQMLEALLRLDGHEVLTAENGVRGLELIKREHPDVALVDIGLPEMDGYTVARNARESSNSHPLRLIALTGYGRSEDRKAAREAGFDAHLVKPLNPKELARVLEW